MADCLELLDVGDRRLVLVPGNQSNNLNRIGIYEDYYEDFLTKLGREQLTRLTERGLDLPVALL